MNNLLTVIFHTKCEEQVRVVYPILKVCIAHLEVYICSILHQECTHVCFSPFPKIKQHIAMKNEVMRETLFTFKQQKTKIIKSLCNIIMKSYTDEDNLPGLTHTKKFHANKLIITTFDVTYYNKPYCQNYNRNVL